MESDSFEINYPITNRNQVNDLYSTLDSKHAAKYFGSPRQLRVDQLKSICSSSAFSVNIKVQYIKEGFGFFSNNGMTFFDKKDACKVSEFVPEISTGNLLCNQLIPISIAPDPRVCKNIQRSIIVSSRNATNLYHYISEIIPSLEICSPHISRSYSISIPTLGIDCNPVIAKQVSLDREVLP